MRKLLGILIGILLISHQLHSSVAFDLIGTASGVLSLVQFVCQIVESIYGHKPVDPVLTAVQKLQGDLKYDMTSALNMLNDLPDLIKYEIKLNDLENSFREIEGIFKHIIRVKKYVNAGSYESEDYYDLLRLKVPILESNIERIKETFVDGNTTFLLAQSFTKNLLKFEDVCKIGKSQLQLMDALLGNLKVIYVQYYLSVKWIYDFQELNGKNWTLPKKLLNDSVNRDFEKAVRQYQSKMSTVSVDLVKCDPEEGYNDAIRYTEKIGPNFAELRIFTNYILGEVEFAPKANTNCVKTHIGHRTCQNIEKLDHCVEHGHRLCRSVRNCPGKLIDCYTLQPEFLYVCENKNSSAHQRYMSVSGKDFHCDQPHRKVATTPIRLTHNYAPRVICEQCSCLCEEEEEYYVDTQWNLAQYPDRIVVGAQLIVENNHLRIQIQQALPGPNGTISDVTWKDMPKIDPKQRERISYDEFKTFSLTPVKVPSDSVVIGFSFGARDYYNEKGDIPRKRIQLHVYTRKFDFRKGRRAILNPGERDLSFGKRPTRKYDLSGRDAPTKSKRPNKPDTADDQYVELTVTDYSKDGGQSVVPFIDTQKVEAHGPLSGAQLYVRGQPGFGGFLAIRLFTYDIRPYVDPWVGL